MNRPVRAIAVSALLLLAIGTPCLAKEAPVISHPVETVVLDAKNYYLAPSNLLKLGIGIAVAAVPANTNADQWIRDEYQEEIRSDRTDDLAKIFKVPGDWFVAAPVYLGAFGAGRLLEIPVLEQWAQRSARATVVGVPAVLFLQVALGGNRPTEGDSHWRPFQNSHGVSGHAFIGSIPFLTAAKMSDSPYAKGVLYGLSTLTGLSRINDDAHYFSQVALGWYLAYLACEVVSKGDAERAGDTQFGIAPLAGGMAITVHRVY